MAREKTIRVRMLVGWAGDQPQSKAARKRGDALATFSYEPGDEVDLPESLAVALCTEPEGDPRAEPVGELPHQRMERRPRQQPLQHR